MKYWLMIAAIAIALLVAGCSVEQKTGTRVVFAFPAGKGLSRDELVSLSKYLKTKGELILGVKGPRVDAVSDRTLTLLLPGKKIAPKDVRKLVEPASIDLYHLSRVATAKQAGRPWKLKVPSSPQGSYIFLGPNAQRVDSAKDPKALLNEIVGPSAKPVLTGRNILPTAFTQQLRQEWAVQVKFDDTGARILRDFTKSNLGEYLAVFYNGRLISAPLVKETIPTGDARITGFATEALARAAVTDLNAGNLPTAVKITRVEYY